MKVAAIIQARMSSTRLPGKVLMSLAGQPVLAHVINRIGHCQTIGQTIVATSIDPSDDAIEAWCGAHGVTCQRGSLNDVLDRYYQVAKTHAVDVIVRITADCPAIDPTVVDEVVGGFLGGGYEFFGLAGEFPDGLDCTVFAFSAIERAWREARFPSEREHVGPYIEKHPELFKSGALRKFEGLSHHRWTLDEPRDYEFLKIVFQQLADKPQPFLAADVLDLLARQPELAQINSQIIRNEGYLKSLQSEKDHHVQP